MSFFFTSRRFAARVTPFLARRQLHSSSSSSCLANNNNIFHRFYSSVKKVGADERLSRVIQSEIDCAQLDNENDQTSTTDQGGLVPADFPFEIADNPGDQTITLKRQLAGESIQVEVRLLDDMPEELDADDNNDDQHSANFDLSFTVTISKEDDGPHLEFHCTAGPDEFHIQTLHIKTPHHPTAAATAYDGPEFSDLDESLQKAFHEYLEKRGIKSSLTNFLQEYMMKKDSREYLAWLKNMKQFVEK